MRIADDRAAEIVADGLVDVALLDAVIFETVLIERQAQRGPAGAPKESSTSTMKGTLSKASRTFAATARRVSGSGP